MLVEYDEYYPYHSKQSFAFWANLLVTDYTFQLLLECI